jgi:hypothetical protein
MDNLVVFLFCVLTATCRVTLDSDNINSDRQSRTLLFDQSATGQYAFCQSMCDSVYPFQSRVCDNFVVQSEAYAESLVWWGGYWSMQTNPLGDFTIEFYEDSSGYQQPKQEPIYSERVDRDEIELNGYYRYEASIPPFLLSADTTYWIVFMAHIVWPPHWGVNCSWPGNSPGWGDGQECYFKSDLFGYLEWTPASSALGEPYESSFQIHGTLTGVEETPDRDNHVHARLSVAPNPSYALPMHITYVLQQPGHIALSVYDCTGRCIRRLVNSWRDKGSFTVLWDGSDMYGRTMTNGIYFVKLISEGSTDTYKIILLR